MAVNQHGLVRLKLKTFFYNFSSRQTLGTFNFVLLSVDKKNCFAKIVLMIYKILCSIQQGDTN
jgi:hypothetical protein